MANTTVTAPELSSDQVLRVLVLPLREQSKWLSSGVKVVDSAGPLRVPVMKGLVTVGTTTPEDPSWVAESGVIPESDVDFGQVQLLPSTLTSIKIISRWSAELARSAVVAIDSAIQGELIFKVVEKLDRQFFSAGGDGITTPLGILAYPGVQVIDKANTAISIDDLIDAWGMALSGNVNMNSLRWIMRSSQFIALNKIKEISGSQRPVLQPDLTAAGGFRLLGAPVIVTDHLALGPDSTDVGTEANEGNVVLADMSQILVARDIAPSVTILKELFAKTDEIGIRVCTRYDSAPLNPTAIVKITNLL